MSKVITAPKQLDFRLSELPAMDKPGKLFMVRPTHFAIDYVINPYMKDHVGKVDKEAAARQWEAVREAFVQTGMEVHVLEGEPDLPDMVFCANQSLPFRSDNGDKEVIMSIMNSARRKPEVAPVEAWYAAQGYERHHLNYKKINSFEGMGDALWHPGRKLLWGGYGFRTSKAAYGFITKTFEVPAILLELRHPEFYHLDTCFCALNEQTVLIYPPAFTKTGLQMIRKLFPKVIEATKEDALHRFACNATCPNGKQVVIQQGSSATVKQLQEHGFEVIEVETGEFLKSGGSVFCMKMMAW